MNVTTRLLLSYATCRWLLIPVVALHNAEEWITVPRYGSIAPTLQDHFTGLFTPPAFRVMEISWIIVTLVPALVVLAAASAGRSRVRDWLVCWVTSIYLANAFLPHLLEFDRFGGMTSGGAEIASRNMRTTFVDRGADNHFKGKWISVSNSCSGVLLLRFR
jgi:hypothetical protein